MQLKVQLFDECVLLLHHDPQLLQLLHHHVPVPSLLHHSVQESIDLALVLLELLDHSLALGQLFCLLLTLLQLLLHLLDNFLLLLQLYQEIVDRSTLLLDLPAEVLLLVELSHLIALLFQQDLEVLDLLPCRIKLLVHCFSLSNLGRDNLLQLHDRLFLLCQLLSQALTLIVSSSDPLKLFILHRDDGIQRVDSVLGVTISSLQPLLVVFLHRVDRFCVFPPLLSQLVLMFQLAHLALLPHVARHGHLLLLARQDLLPCIPPLLHPRVLFFLYLFQGCRDLQQPLLQRCDLLLLLIEILLRHAQDGS
mmetsp:Transcript_13342/g.46576  ORF Transcript_13342/g.46576 Transcript_13342/m.46576 type:complete len:307 (-) Transcript_13342:378-1298(-)